MRKVPKMSKGLAAIAKKFLARGRRMRRAKVCAAQGEENRQRKRRVLIHGPEPWRVVKGVTFTHWDRWFLRLAIEDGDNWVKLEKALQESRYSVRGSTSEAEAKLSHLADLRNRLLMVRKTPRAVLRQEVNDRALLSKANTKVFGQYLDLKYATSAMCDTPRHRLERRALRGHWGQFPVSPSLFEERIFEVGSAHFCYSVGATMRLADRIYNKVERLVRKADGVGEQLAICRAGLTAILVAVERADDSCGSLGDTFSMILEEYSAVPWQESGIGADIYWWDLIELAAWEDYGFSEDLEGCFKSISPAERDVVFGVLDRVCAELHEYGFNYQEEKVGDIRATVLIEQRQWDLMEDLARSLGSRRRKPIMKMAEAALKKRKVALASAIFQAADQPGAHQSSLREQARILLRKTKRR